MSSTAPPTVRLRLICLAPPAHNPPDGEEVCGLQDRHGQLHVGALQADGSVRYDVTVRCAARSGVAAPRLSGPLVHGPAGAPFLYLSVREPNSGAWLRRLKIPLAPITLQHIAAADATDQGYLLARIAGSGSGTVPLLDEGWQPGP